MSFRSQTLRAPSLLCVQVMNQVHPAARQRLVSNVIAANVKRLAEALQNRVLSLPHRTASLSLARAGLLRILSGLGVAIPTTVAASGGTRSTGATCASCPMFHCQCIKSYFEAGTSQGNGSRLKHRPPAFWARTLERRLVLLPSKGRAMPDNPSRNGSSNRILARLAREDFALLQPHLQAVDLPVRNNSRRASDASTKSISSRLASPQWWPTAVINRASRSASSAEKA